MEQFSANCDKLFELFKSQSRLATSATPTDRSVTQASQTELQDDNSLVVYNFTFDQFIKCFDQMKSVFLVSSHQSKNYIREFFEEATELITSGKLALTLPIEERICAFYLLYTLWFLYNKSFKFPFKIRIDLCSHINLKTLVSQSLDRKQIDIVIAYRKLVALGAFDLCHSIALQGPYYKDYMLSTKKIDISNNTQSEQFVQDMQTYQELMDSLGINENFVKNEDMC